MFPQSPFAYPVSSFQTPVSVPGVDPDTGEQVGVFFSKVWLPYIIGSLFQLVQQTTWDTNDPTIQKITQGQAMDLINLFCLAAPKVDVIQSFSGEENDMSLLFEPFVDTDGQCKFHFRCCVDDPWITLANASAAVAPSQPGVGTPLPAPNGGKKCYEVRIDPESKWWIPVRLNSGDVVSTGLPDQMWTGSTNDGTDSTLYCASGAVYNQGDCNSAGAHTVVTDPLNTAPHMSVLLWVNGVLYPIVDTSVTIPGGVSNAQGYLVFNESNSSICSGELVGNMCITNNQAANYTHTWDLRNTPGLWQITPTEGGHWVSGVGFVSDTSVPGNGDNVSISILTVPTGTYTTWSVTVVCTDNTNQLGVYLQNGVNTDTVPVPVGTTVVSAGHAPIAGNQLSADVTNRPIVGLGAYTIVTATVSGTGTDPF